MVRAIPYYSGGQYAQLLRAPHRRRRRSRQPHHRHNPRTARYRSRRPGAPRTGRTRAALQRAPAPLCLRRSPSRKLPAPASASKMAKSAGRSGASASRSTPARDLCSTRWAMRIAAACARFSIADRFRKWWSPTAIPPAAGSSATASMPANWGSDSMPHHSAPGVDCPRELYALRRGPIRCRRPPRCHSRAPSPSTNATAGIAWKHDEEARRARDLVLGFVSTVGNYDYGFDWIFHQDGTLEMRVALTGVMAAKAIADGCARPVQPQSRTQPRGAPPPALFHLPARSGCGRSHAQSSGRDEHRAGACRSGESLRRRLSDGRNSLPDRRRGAAQSGPFHRPQVDRDQSESAQCARPPHRIRPAPRRERRAFRSTR